MAVAAVAFPDIAEGFVARKPTLNQVRVRKLLSLYELGQRSHIAASTILKIERGSKPRLSTIGKLARALGIEPTDIAWPGDPLGEGDGDENA